MIKTYRLSTPREGFLAVTAQVQEALRDSGVESGLCVVYCPHTTAGVTINENADPDVTRDLMLALDKTFPDRTEFRRPSESRLCGQQRHHPGGKRPAAAWDVAGGLFRGVRRPTGAPLLCQGAGRS